MVGKTCCSVLLTSKSGEEGSVWGSRTCDCIIGLCDVGMHSAQVFVGEAFGVGGSIQVGC